MNKERILSKKVRELNKLKSYLVLRSEEDKEEIVERIKDTVEDIDLILKDYEYVSDIEKEFDVDLEIFVKRGGYRCDSQFTVDELERYNDEGDNLLYISVDGTVYDVTESRFWKNKVGGKDATERIFSSNALEDPKILNEGKVVGTLLD